MSKHTPGPEDNANLLGELLKALEALERALANEPEPTRRRLVDERTAARAAIARAKGDGR